MVRLKRFFVILISMVFCFVLQLLILPGIPYLKAVPNLLLIEVMSVGFLYGKAVGLAAGTAAGLLLDLLGIGIPGFYTLILAVLGYADGMLSEKLESELILILYFLFLLNELFYHAYVFVFSFLLRKSFVLPVYLKEVVIPETLLSLVCFLLIYGFLIFISKRWDLKVNKGEVKVVS